MDIAAAAAGCIVAAYLAGPDSPVADSLAACSVVALVAYAVAWAVAGVVAWAVAWAVASIAAGKLERYELESIGDSRKS